MTGADLLYGIKAIAAELGIRPKQAEHRVAQKAIPTFKMGRTVCASRGELRKLIAAGQLGKGAPDDEQARKA